MAENAGSDENEFGSVTSSQRSFLNNHPFADPHSPPVGMEDTYSDCTEVLGTPVWSPAVTRTPILSLSTPISLDSINDEDVFRTPPENASLSSAAESEPRARASRSKSPPPTTPVSASPSLIVKTNLIADPEVTDVTPLISPPTAGNVKVASKSKSRSPVSAPPSLPAETVRVLEMNRVSDPDESVTAGDVRVPGKQSSDLDSSPSSSATEEIEVTDYDIDIPFKEVIEALLRNSGENLDDGRDERVSYINILKKFGINFP